MTHAVFSLLPHLVDIGKASEQIKEPTVKFKRQQTEAGLMRGAQVDGCLLLDRQLESEAVAGLQLCTCQTRVLCGFGQQRRGVTGGVTGGLQCQTPA